MFSDLKQRQIFILKLLNHIMEPVMDKDIEEIGMTFKLEDNVKLFTVSKREINTVICVEIDKDINSNKFDLILV